MKLTRSLTAKCRKSSGCKYGFLQISRPKDAYRSYSPRQWAAVSYAASQWLSEVPALRTSAAFAPRSLKLVEEWGFVQHTAGTYACHLRGQNLANTVSALLHPEHMELFTATSPFANHQPTTVPVWAQNSSLQTRLHMTFTSENYWGVNLLTYFSLLKVITTLNIPASCSHSRSREDSSAFDRSSLLLVSLAASTGPEIITLSSAALKPSRNAPDWRSATILNACSGPSYFKMHHFKLR